jgi:DMSO reductase family type II enzyme heme b subunit
LLIAGCAQRSQTASSSAAANKDGESSQPRQATGEFARNVGAAGSSRPASSAKVAENLYRQNCAGCHGDKGDGKGIAAAFLFPRPRDFRAGNFRLVTTENGVPTIADLQAVIERGMPGSAMPPWPGLSADEHRLLAEYVFELRRQGARDIELALAAEEETERTPQELAEAIAPVTTPGATIEVPPLAAATPERIERGRELYRAKGCAACHGNEGRGDGQQQMVDVEGLPTRPRDLTRGLFKGSPDPASIYRRILSGMPGTPMPALRNASSAEISDLVWFVLSLSDEATRAAAVPKRNRLVAPRVAAIAHDPSATFWTTIEPTRLRTIPLWWRDDPDPWIEVQAAHDGKSLAVRIGWSNAQPSDSALRSQDFQDAVAVELVRGPVEPFLGMGSADAPVEVWMWGADRNGRRGDVETANPHLVVDQYAITEQVVPTAEYHRRGTATADQAKVTLSSVATGNQITPLAHRASASRLETAGPGSTTFRPPTSQVASGRGAWSDGRWSVVLTRPLVVKAEEGISFAPAERLSIAFAVWDGRLRDRDGQKRITIWQELELATSAARPTAKE